MTEAGDWRQLFAGVTAPLRLGGLSLSLADLFAAAVTLAVVWLLARGVRRAFDRHARERQVRSRAAIYTVARLATYGLYALGLLVALSFLGIPTSRFAVVAGAIGVGIGFGLQAIFRNFVSGIVLIFDRSLTHRRLRRAGVGDAGRGARHQHPLDADLAPTTTSTSWCPTRSSSTTR